MTEKQASHVVLGWWRADGPRTLSRLRELSEHVAYTLALDMDAVYGASCAGVLAFERADMVSLHGPQP